MFRYLLIESSQSWYGFVLITLVQCIKIYPLIQVAGIVRNAYGPQGLQEAIQRHGEVRVKGLIRGSTKEQFAHGVIIPRGKRLPAGGAIADTYRFYDDKQADMAADPEIWVGTLFDHATVRLPFS